MRLIIEEYSGDVAAPSFLELLFFLGRKMQAAGSHEIWYHPETNRYTTLPNHSGDMPEGTLKAILKQAGITTEDFLGK